MKSTTLVAGASYGLLKAGGGSAAAVAEAGAAPGSVDPIGDLSCLAHTHDLRLPDWGSYSRSYNGLSHVADKRQGLRFDLNVFPGYFRRYLMVPNVNWESGYHPWEAAADLSYFSHRYELEWKDRVYCDVSFSAISEHSRLIRAEFVNRTDVAQDMVLHYLASLNLGGARPDRPSMPPRILVKLPPGAVWVDALDYADLQFARPRPTDSLMPDGLRRAEVRDPAFVGGGGIARRFGRDAGDRIRFAVNLPQPIDAAVLLVRYRKPSKKAARFDVSGTELSLPPAKEFALGRLELGSLSAGRHELELVSKGSAAIDFDGIVIVGSSRAAEVAFEDVPVNVKPTILPGPVSQSRLLKYDELPQHYGIAWKFEPYQVREILNSELDRFLRFHAQNHVRNVFHGDEKGHFTNVYLRPISLPAGATRVVYGIAADGEQSEVAEAIGRINASEAELERIYTAARSRAVQMACVPAGEPYRFSQERMAATTLTNVIFPVYAKRSYFRHYTVGKYYDTLYTWDSGFLGLGLTELDINRTIDCLNTYTTEPGDPENAFIHHGTPVPVQHYLFLELWNRTQSRRLLEYFYPRLRQYHQFLAGRLGSSTTRRLESNLLQTWDYFYNTGWDDYPPQVYMHEQKMAKRTACAITSSHVIRTARILAQAARVLGATDDIPGYEDDIAVLSEPLQKYSWDPDVGYYSYVLHNERGEPTGLLRDESGANFNMGLDGVMPLMAGICTPAQTTTLLDHLKTEGRLWCPIGLSTVDQTAPYYRTDGYWNGAVWFPHQWFMWKTMLDLGETAFAEKIAQTALDLWRAEVDETYHCFEHFLIHSRRGAGWYQFSGLSTPVLSWFSAYYRPGRLTVGLDAWVHRCDVGDDQCSMRAELELRGRKGGAATVLATMAADRDYKVVWQGQPAKVAKAVSGTLQITLPSDAGRGVLEITRA
ncbi:MAG: hypothetical protein JXA69_03370 [Phycisphaerae bacterium]|nr:hypothetical protein [Phycisphaerae bacterium]